MLLGLGGYNKGRGDTGRFYTKIPVFVAFSATSGLHRPG